MAGSPRGYAGFTGLRWVRRTVTNSPHANTRAHTRRTHTLNVCVQRERSALTQRKLLHGSTQGHTLKYKHVANQGRNSQIHTLKVTQTFRFFFFFFTSAAQVSEATCTSLLDSKQHFPATQEPWNWMAIFYYISFYTFYMYFYSLYSQSGLPVCHHAQN